MSGVNCWPQSVADFESRAGSNFRWHKVERAILKGRLAPFPPQIPAAASCEECPICFRALPTLNRTACCLQLICTECFLFLRPIKSCHSTCAVHTRCPYCGRKEHLQVQYLPTDKLHEQRDAAEKSRSIWKRLTSSSFIKLDSLRHLNKK